MNEQEEEIQKKETISISYYFVDYRNLARRACASVTANASTLIELRRLLNSSSSNNNINAPTNQIEIWFVLTFEMYNHISSAQFGILFSVECEMRFI